MDKIINLSGLPEVISKIKTGSKKTVLVGGCFDILHIGHVRFLTKSKTKGDILIVALESNENVKRLKGGKRPIQNQEERAEILAALQAVDYVLLLPEMRTDNDYSSLVNKIKPDVIALTEGDRLIQEKTKQAKQTGAVIEIVSKMETHSTSELSKIVGLD